MQKAMKQLTVERYYNPEAPIFPGIGYAILALVTLTKEKKEGGNISWPKETNGSVITHEPIAERNSALGSHFF